MERKEVLVPGYSTRMYKNVPLEMGPGATNLEPGVYRGQCILAGVVQPPARLDKTLWVVFRLVDASMNAVGRVVRDALNIGGADSETSRRRLIRLAGAARISRVSDSSQFVGRVVGIIVDNRGRVAAYRDPGVDL